MKDKNLFIKMPFLGVETQFFVWNLISVYILRISNIFLSKLQYVQIKKIFDIRKICTEIRLHKKK